MKKDITMTIILLIIINNNKNDDNFNGNNNNDDNNNKKRRVTCALASSLDTPVIRVITRQLHYLINL